MTANSKKTCNKIMAPSANNQPGKVHRSFQRALDTYAHNAHAQKAIAQRLVELFMSTQPLHTHYPRVLEFGCGTGFLTQSLTPYISADKAILNDLVPNCEAFLKADYAQTQQFIAGDIETIDLPQQLDLVCSASTIQWAQNPEHLLQKLASKMTSDSYLLLSSFSTQHFVELATLQQADSNNLSLSYWSAQQWQTALEPFFKVNLIQHEPQIMWFDSVRDILLHLRLTGVNGNTRQTWSQQKLMRFEQQYQQQFQQNGRLQLSYDPIYIIAQRHANADN